MSISRVVFASRTNSANAECAAFKAQHTRTSYSAQRRIRMSLISQCAVYSQLVCKGDHCSHVLDYLTISADF